MPTGPASQLRALSLASVCALTAFLKRAGYEHTCVQLSRQVLNVSQLRAAVLCDPSLSYFLELSEWSIRNVN